MSAASWIVLGHAGAAVLLGMAYFRRYQVTRPPLGVFNLADVLALLGAVVLVPCLYLFLPRPPAVALLGAGMVSAVYLTGEPVLRRPRWLWPLVLGLVAAELTVGRLAGTSSSFLIAVNNVVVLFGVVGVTNLWAQSGMKARDLAVLAGALAVYDVVATSWLPLTTDLLDRLAGGPFAPQVVWPSGAGGHAGIGLGDLLLATLAPLVLRKAYGRTAGVVAAVTALGAFAALFALPALGVSLAVFPAMVALGPLIVVQEGYWSLRRGRERRTWQYLQAEPLRGAPTPSVAGGTGTLLVRTG